MIMISRSDRRVMRTFGVGAFLACIAAIPAIAQAPMTAKQVIDQIQQHSGGPWQGPTVDTIKAGDPNTPVTGIATTFTDTYDVLERAAEAGANLIISHEPSFYNHQDDTKALTDDPVFRAKMAFIQQHHMVVFRFHDHWHAPVMKPDGIMHGMLQALGWQSYQSHDNQMLFTMPETTLGSLASEIAKRLQIRTLRAVGNPSMKVRNVAFLPGAAGSDRQIQALRRPDVDVLIVGETREWETVLYTADAVFEHRPKALIVMGHDVSEEEGMRYCVDWLKAFLPGLPVTFIPAGEPFWTPASRSGME